MKFSMGHSSKITFTVLKGTDEHWIDHPEFENFRQQYMHAGAAEHNTANVIGFRRIRDKAPDAFKRKTEVGSDWLPTRIYGDIYASGKMKPAHPEWIEHPDKPNRETYIYGDEYILGTSNMGRRKGHDYRVR